MNLKEVIYGSEEHKATIALRNKILRDPIGLVFLEQDLKDEEDAFHIGCFSWKSGELIGCCFFTPLSDTTIKLRQMAVDTAYQQIGIGSKVISFAEELAKEKGFEYVYLHARKEAVEFYKKHGYTLESDEFMEVGIPHFEMLKKI